MIQRIQTIFLVLILGVFGILFAVPVFHTTVPYDDHTLVMALKLQHLKISCISLLPIVLIALIAIFMYKNRKRQLLVVNIGMLLSLTFFVLCIAFPELFSSSYLIKDGKPIVEYGTGVYLIGLIPALFFLAGRFIKKDENLVKAADRLR
jgi:ABC-type proline/glycine betaine transport system permease subunit